MDKFGNHEFDSEKTLETRLRLEIKKRGGKAYKWVSPGTNGVPDRIVIMPKNLIYFVELKTTGKVPDPLQRVMHKILREMGCKVFVIDRMRLLIDFLEIVDHEQRF